MRRLTSIERGKLENLAHFLNCIGHDVTPRTKPDQSLQLSQSQLNKRDISIALKIVTDSKFDYLRPRQEQGLSWCEEIKNRLVNV